MNDSDIVFGLISCMGIEYISVDLISENCHILREDARLIIKRAKEKDYLFCNSDLEEELPLVVSNDRYAFDLDRVCVINGDMKLDGSGLK